MAEPTGRQGNCCDSFPGELENGAHCAHCCCQEHWTSWCWSNFRPLHRLLHVCCMQHQYTAHRMWELCQILYFPARKLWPSSGRMEMNKQVTEENYSCMCCSFTSNPNSLSLAGRELELGSLLQRSNVQQAVILSAALRDAANTQQLFLGDAFICASAKWALISPV